MDDAVKTAAIMELTGLYLLAGFGMLSAIVAGFFIDVPRVVVRGQRAPAE